MFEHVPVMLESVLNNLKVESASVYLDLTAGGGGHAKAFRSHFPNMRMILVDRDSDAIAHLKESFSGDELTTVVHSKASELEKVLFLLKVKKVDIVLADLGVSSHQFDVGERGFSFQNDGPLDMRMDRSEGMTAIELIQDTPFGELVKLLSEYGQERESKRVARALKEAAENGVKSSVEFANVIKGVKRYGKKGIHPATLVFQALRMAVNEEPQEINLMLDKAYSVLASKGRMGIITFHSIEDRLVKHFYALKKNGREGFVAEMGDDVIVHKAVKPTEEEVRDNSRARSAKLRVIEKL